MLSYIQAIILGGLQGVSELFPISSLGHSVVFPKLFGWNVHQADSYFLIFLVATHLATSLVLLGFYRKDWIRIVKGIIRSLKEREIKTADTYAKIGWLLVIGTIPAGILGLLFEEKIKLLFASPRFAALFIIVNGLLLWGMEYLKKRQMVVSAELAGDSRIAELTWMQTVKIGCAQCLALIPGLSRTGATLGGGLLIGLKHEDALRFSFLLATPIIFAAAVLKLPELWTASGGTPVGQLGPLIVGSLVSACAAYLSVTFLTRYFKTNTLKPFAIYCVVFGVLTSIIFLF